MKTKGLIFIIGFILLLAVAFIGGRLPYFILYFYLGLIFLPLFHGLIGKYKLIGSIDLPARDLVAGEKIELITRFSNPTKVLFPHLEYKSTIAELLSNEFEPPKTFHLSPDETFVDKRLINCHRRGIYTIGETQLLIKDVFNIFEFRKKLQAPIAIKIYPRILPLSDFTVEAGIQMGNLIVDDPTFQDYSAIDTLRDYRNGDSVKKIHWRASAKHDQLIVKEFEYRGDAEVILMLNDSLLDYKNDTYRKIEDKIVEVCVSITHFCLLNHLNISYLTTHNNHYEKTSGSSDTYLKVFLEKFVEFSPRNLRSIKDELINFSPSISQGTTIIIVTPCLSKELATELIHLKMSNIHPMVFLINTHDTTTFQYQNQLHLIQKMEAEAISVLKVSL